MNSATAHSQPPLVAHIIDELPPDGAERLLVDLMRRRSGRFRYVIVCLVRGGPLEADFKESGVPVVIMGRRRKLDVGLVIRLARWLRSERVEVVHTHLSTADAFGRTAALLAGVRAIFSTSHNLNEGKSLPHRMLDRLLAVPSERVIGCTEEVGRLLVQRDGLPPSKVAVVENGVDLRRFDSVSGDGVRHEFDIGQDAVLLGVVGRLHPQKGHADLLEALVALRTLTHRRFQCLFVGEGELRQSLESEVDRLGLRDVVRFSGLRRDVPRLLKSFDVFVMPSRWEGLPMALLEAMACAKAAVVTSVGGVPSVIDHKENGWLIAPEQPELMANALATVINDDRLRASLGSAARVSALQRYDVGRALQSYEDFYVEALGIDKSTSQAVAHEGRS